MVDHVADVGDVARPAVLHGCVPAGTFGFERRDQERLGGGHRLEAAGPRLARGIAAAARHVEHQRQEPAAVVHLKPGGSATEDELRQWVCDRLAGFKVPVKVAFWPETLPRNANGKIMKSELKKVFAKEAERA